MNLMNKENWYSIKNAERIISPSLLVYPDRIEKNIKTMLQIAGGPAFLRPHIKTHKIAEIIQMQLKYGIEKFKCATIAEAELLARAGAKDILLAIQPVGPNILRFFDLLSTFPQVQFSTIVDGTKVFDEIADMANSRDIVVSLWLDINNGMHRTGIPPGEEAIELYKKMTSTPRVIAEGLHVYDGHIRDSDIKIRTQECNRAFEAVTALKSNIENLGIPVKTIAVGGTPTFPIHAKRSNVELSPGTTLLWDNEYNTQFPDLKIIPAAVLITRIISKPQPGYICLDLGHKSVAPEMPLPRVKFLTNVDFEQVGQSEEHLVVTTKESEKYELGELFYAIPDHICPTVAKYHEVTTIIDHLKAEVWEVAARNNKITI